MLGQPTRVRVVKGADVVELDDVTALVAALERALARDLLLPISIRPCAYLPEQFCSYSEPVNLVGVGRETSATSVLFVTGTVDDDGVVESSYRSRVNLHFFPSTQITDKPRVPFLEASRGLMSKMSIPCIFPISSRRSRPVACSTSVGTVPDLAPGGIKSSSVLISIRKTNPD